ncbi:PREDICTED: general transcription factor II-I repeat domain-containing protein 2B-like [Habropoda laboriosa]|uniref:general transcription factor II-I repeat domain-containing protein 2B-like n=1 Tax=Habropoda laboriosa TaxID=597456 RepID=UPI00083CA645|nr:PREDICTED: general transcription factor II-I repeat domain-containing protein 2B-like [Habropoda laboriosa]
MQSKFKDQMFLKELAFITDVTDHLNVPNLKLQKRDQTVSDMISCINAHGKRFDSFVTEISRNELYNFPSCEELKDDLSDSDAEFSMFASTLRSVVDEFDTRFKDFDLLKGDLAIFNNPMKIHIPNQNFEYRIELCDVQADQFVISRGEIGLEFFKLLPESKYPKLRNLGLKICSMFGSTYMCESAFSSMKYIKFLKRALIADSSLTYLMRIASSEIPIDIPALFKDSSAMFALI